MYFGLLLLVSLTMNPFVMIIILIFTLLSLCLILIFVLSNYFFCYLIFLLFMSGLIMMLVYFCSIILSEKFLFLPDFFLLGVFFFGSGSLIHVDCVEFIISPALGFMYFELVGLLKYLIYPYSFYSLFFIGYLLFCLVVVYEIIKHCVGPLRVKT